MDCSEVRRDREDAEFSGRVANAYRGIALGVQYLDRACLDETAGLLFLPQNDLTADEQARFFSSSDWRDNAVLIRVPNDGPPEGVFPRSGIPAEDQPGLSLDQKCGIGDCVRNSIA